MTLYAVQYSSSRIWSHPPLPDEEDTKKYEERRRKKKKEGRMCMYAFMYSIASIENESMPCAHKQVISLFSQQEHQAEQTLEHTFLA